MSSLHDRDSSTPSGIGDEKAQHAAPAAADVKPADTTPPSPGATLHVGPITITDFQNLLGIPTEYTKSPLYAGWWSHKPLPQDGLEDNIGVYGKVICEYNWAMKKYYAYDFLTYGSLIAQLVISAVLIILGALRDDHHLSIAILGSVNGVITGVLSLIRGVGYPMRLLQYADSLRKVKDDIQWTYAELKAKKRVVTYEEVEVLKERFDLVRLDHENNRPDVWTTSVKTPTGGNKAPSEPVSSNTVVKK